MSDMSLSPFRGQQTAEEILEPSPLSKLRRRIFKNHSFLIGAVILILILLCALLAPLLAPEPPPWDRWLVGLLVCLLTGSSFRPFVRSFAVRSKRNEKYSRKKTYEQNNGRFFKSIDWRVVLQLDTSKILRIILAILDRDPNV